MCPLQRPASPGSTRGVVRQSHRAEEYVRGRVYPLRRLHARSGARMAHHCRIILLPLPVVAHAGHIRDTLRTCRHVQSGDVTRSALALNLLSPSLLLTSYFPSHQVIAIVSTSWGYLPRISVHPCWYIFLVLLTTIPILIH